jgi:hypothetical protein
MDPVFRALADPTRRAQRTERLILRGELNVAACALVDEA